MNTGHETSYGELISIRVRGRGVEKEYAIDRSAATATGDHLERFGGYSWTHAEWGSKHTEIAAQLDDEGGGAESVIIISELLAEEHFDDEDYVILREQDIVSEVRETAWRHFEREINDEMAAWLNHHRDPDDKHLEEVFAKYEKQALVILEEDYREWEIPFDRDAVTRPRKETLRERRYLLPSPFDFWDSRNSYQQYFFLKGSKTVAKSGSGGSGQRANHSIFGLGFALHDAVRPVPTRILVYDRDNRVIEVDTLDRLCLVALDLGSNYDLPYAEVNAATEHVLRCDWKTHDWTFERPRR